MTPHHPEIQMGSSPLCYFLYKYKRSTPHCSKLRNFESNCPPLETKSIFTCKNPLCDSSMISCFIQFGRIKADGMQIVQPLSQELKCLCERARASECPSAVCGAHSSLRALLKIIRPRPASCQIHLPLLSLSLSLLSLVLLLVDVPLTHSGGEHKRMILINLNWRYYYYFDMTETYLEVWISSLCKNAELPRRLVPSATAVVEYYLFIPPSVSQSLADTHKTTAR